MSKLFHAALAGLAFAVLAGTPAATGDAATPPDTIDYIPAPRTPQNLVVAPPVEPNFRHPRLAPSARRSHARP